MLLVRRHALHLHGNNVMGMARQSALAGKPQSHQWLFGSEDLAKNASAQDLHSQCSGSTGMSLQRFTRRTCCFRILHLLQELKFMAATACPSLHHA